MRCLAAIALVACAALNANSEDIHSWCVTPCYTQPAIGIRVYAATGIGSDWTMIAQITDVEPDGTYCWTEDMETVMPEQAVVYFVFNVFNGAGESQTEHGSAFGDGYEPELPCP